MLTSPANPLLKDVRRAIARGGLTDQIVIKPPIPQSRWCDLGSIIGVLAIDLGFEQIAAPVVIRIGAIFCL